MDRSLSITSPSGLPTPARPPAPPLEFILAGSAAAFMGLYEARGARLSGDLLAPHVARAESFLRQCEAWRTKLQEAAEPAFDDDIAGALLQFVGAWPNASNGDLAAYGAQLAQDVMERRPCRYALEHGLRQLRQTSRFLPSIAEVLGAVDGAQARVRNTVWHLQQIEEMMADGRPTADADGRQP